MPDDGRFQSNRLADRLKRADVSRRLLGEHDESADETTRSLFAARGDGASSPDAYHDGSGPKAPDPE